MSQIFPIDIPRVRNPTNPQSRPIEHQEIQIPIGLLQYILPIMLILKTYKSFPHKICYIEQDTIITRILFIQHNLTIIKKFDLFGYGREPVIGLDLHDTQTGVVLLLFEFFPKLLVFFVVSDQLVSLIL